MANERRRRSDVNRPVQLLQAQGRSIPQPDEGAIRQRAYDHYRERAYEDGHDVDDWLQAERELRGS
jgi:hypothetical protein